MKHLFLTSQVQYVASHIGGRVLDAQKKNSVYITTPIKDKQHSHLGWHYTNRSKLENAGFHFDEYDITNKNFSQIESEIGNYDSMYIEGGNSYYLLQESQKSGFINFVRRRVEEGMIFISTSAGTVAAGPDIEPVRREETTILAPQLQNTEGYKLVNFVVMPHWGQEEWRALYNTYRLEHIYQEDYPYITLNDYQYIEVMGDTFQIHTVSA